MQAIETKYLAPTNFMGARIKVYSQAKSKIYPWDYALNEEQNHIAAVEKLCAELDWNFPGTFWARGDNAKGTGYVFVNVKTSGLCTLCDFNER